MTHQLWAFLGISLLVIVTPGPDTALTVRNTLLGGRRAGGFTAAGVAAGQTIWALATSGGLVALLVASEPVFQAVKWVGAGYLVWLGLGSLRSAFRGSAGSTDKVAISSPPLALAIAFRQGVLSDLGNPKMAVFFSSLLPQFAGGNATFASLVLLGLLFCAMTFAWLTGYAVVLSLAGDYVRRRSVWRAHRGRHRRHVGGAGREARYRSALESGCSRRLAGYRAEPSRGGLDFTALKSLTNGKIRAFCQNFTISPLGDRVP